MKPCQTTLLLLAPVALLLSGCATPLEPGEQAAREAREMGIGVRAVDSPEWARAATPAVTYGEPLLSFAPGDGPAAGRRVVLIAGDEEYRSEEALPQLAKILSVRHGFQCTVLFSINPETGTIDPTTTGNIPGLSVLEDADLLVIFTRFRRLPDDAMGHLARFVASKRPIIGIRTATHAFAYEPDSASPYAKWSWDAGPESAWPGGFGRQVLGETWVAHHGDHGKESTRGVIPDAAKTHMIVRGVADVWGPTDVYALAPLPEDATVLLEGEVLAGMSPDSPPVGDARNEPRMPILWVRQIPLPAGGAQRVACSTIGAAVDLKNEGLRRALVNTCYWAVGLLQDIPDKSNVDLVGDYEPSMFGFGGWRKGMRPQDYALPPGNSGESGLAP